MQAPGAQKQNTVFRELGRYFAARLRGGYYLRQIALDPSGPNWYSARPPKSLLFLFPFRYSLFEGESVVRIAGFLCGLLVAFCVLLCVPASGQRVQFPSPAPPAAGVVPDPMVVGPGPTATFNGTIQPPLAQWDPYATPGARPAPLLPQDPYFQFGAPGGSPPPGGTFTRMRRLIDEVRLDYVWMPGDGLKEFGINDAELSVTFAIPFLYNTETPLLVTPGFAIHYWNGPVSLPLVPPPDPPDLPPFVFDAYLDGAWNPQVTPWFGGELSFRVGVYSDFKRVTEESLRYMGKGLAVLSFSPSIKIKAGMWYLDRNRIKLLPAGGLVWTPNPDTYFNILFPDPKIGRRLANYGNTEWWLYARGEYGGGAWTVKRVNPVPAVNDTLDSVDYNDLRCGVGLEFMNQGGLNGLFEVGVAFEREIRYRSKLPEVVHPNTTVFLRGGLGY